MCFFPFFNGINEDGYVTDFDLTYFMHFNYDSVA